MRTLIKNAVCVLPEETRGADVLIEGSQIAGIDPPSTSQADDVVDAAGLHLLPGVIDDQVHFREPGLEHKEDLQTGSMACAIGGVTTFLEMPNGFPSGARGKARSGGDQVRGELRVLHRRDLRQRRRVVRGEADARDQNLHWFEHG